MALFSVVQGLPVQVFRELVHELSEYDTVPINLAGSPRELVDAAIENVDQDQNGFISREEFRELCVLLPRGFEQAQHEAAAVEARRAAAAVTCTQQCCPSFHGSAAFGRLRRVMHDKRFELAMLFVVFINSVLILVELRFEYKPDQSQPGSWNISWWEVVELGFSTLYVVEMILKMIVSGWWRYWRRWRNRFDGVISVVSLGAELLIVVPNAYNQRGAIRFIMFVRMLRVLRVFADLEQFSVIFAAFFDLAPAFSKLGTVLFLIMCGFGQVGIPLFGGEIYRGNPVLVRLSHTPWLLCRVQSLERTACATAEHELRRLQLLRRQLQRLPQRDDDPLRPAHRQQLVHHRRRRRRLLRLARGADLLPGLLSAQPPLPHHLPLSTMDHLTSLTATFHPYCSFRQWIT